MKTLRDDFALRRTPDALGCRLSTVYLLISFETPTHPKGNFNASFSLF